MIGFLVSVKRSRKEKKYAILGALSPDIFMGAAWIVALFTTFKNQIGGFSFETYHKAVHTMWFDMFFSPIVHSLLFWLLLFVILFFFYRKMIFFAVGGLTHVVVDFLTHQGQFTWNILYPIHIPKIQGIFNYWDLRFIIPVHILWIIILTYMYFKKHPNNHRQKE